MKLRFVVLLSSTLCSVSSVGPIVLLCKLHPAAPLCN
jgi:hypothetical protein